MRWRVRSSHPALVEGGGLGGGQRQKFDPAGSALATLRGSDLPQVPTDERSNNSRGIAVDDDRQYFYFAQSGGGAARLYRSNRVSRLAGEPYNELTPDVLAAMSPIKHVDGSEPPILAIHGTLDRDIPSVTSERFVTALQAAGVDAELLLVEGPHGFDVFRRFGSGREFGFVEVGPGRDTGALRI